MNLLKYPFKFLTIYGVWEPENLKSELAKKVYKIYSFVITLLIFLVLITNTLSLVKVSNRNEFNEIFTFNVTFFTLFFRIVYLLHNRNKIIKLKNMLFHEFFVPKNSKEFEIQNYFEYMNEYI